MFETIIYLGVGLIVLFSLAFLALFGWFFVNVVRGIQKDHAAVKPLKNPLSRITKA